MSRAERFRRGTAGGPGGSGSAGAVGGPGDTGTAGAVGGPGDTGTAGGSGDIGGLLDRVGSELPHSPGPADTTAARAPANAPSTAVPAPLAAAFSAPSGAPAPPTAVSSSASSTAFAPLAPAAPALAFRDVHFSYGEGPRAVPALDGATLEVAAGRITGLVGPNGCGKSTLLRAADALVVPSAGAVLVAGPHGELAPVAGLAPAERAGAIALLMQIHRTPSMTVENLVLCGRYAHLGAFGRASARDRAIVSEAMAEAGVLALARKSARSLSGGERQRAFIAMALAQQARVLLLDEPTTFLDPRAARDVMALVARLVRERGLTVLMVLHDVDLALRSCDDIAVMEAGRVVDAGPAPAVLARGTLQRVLGVEIERHDGPHGPSYAVF